MNTKKLFLLACAVLILSNVAAFAALDLRFTTPISMSPSSPVPGNTVTFSVSFKTFGGAVTNLKIIGGMGNNQLFERVYASIPADRVRTDSFTWTAVPGSHTVWFELDPDHASSDSNYANNRVENSFSFGSPSDLLIQVKINDLLSNDRITYIKWIVDNDGESVSLPCTMEIKKSSTVVQTINIISLNPGSEMGGDFLIPEQYKCSGRLTFKVDANNANTESNELNNTDSIMLLCICSNCWDNFEFELSTLSLIPKPCETCPQWHESIKGGDPVGILNRIGEKLGQGADFNTIKGDWEKFLTKTNGLSPVAALEIIFNLAVKEAKERLQDEQAIKQFQQGLKETIKQMAAFANEKLSAK